MTEPSALPQASSSPAAPGGAPQSGDHLAGYSVDELYDFFDFFDKTVEDVYAYVLHCTRVPELASDITLNIYFALMQRRKFFWWKNVVQISTVLALADKEIASMRKWEEEATGSSYLEELLRCSGQKMTTEQMRFFLHALRALPIREQRMATLFFFLHWSAKKTASVIGRDAQTVEREYAAIGNAVSAELLRETAFQGMNVRQMLSLLRCSPVEESKKTALRLALLDRCRAAQVSSMRYLIPVASFLIVTTTLVGFSTMFLTPLSAKSTLEQIAAVEVLLLDRERTDRDTLLAAEEHLRGMGLYYAQRDLALVTMDLAPYAVEKQRKQDQEISDSLRKLGMTSLTLAAFLPSPTVAAAKEP